MSSIDLTQAQPGQRELITPEGVDLRVILADGGQRLGAFLLDLLFMVLTAIAVLIAAVFAYGVAGKDSDEVLSIVFLLFFFLLRSFYFTGFELTARAATPGKRLLGIRVAARNGGRLRAEMEAILAQHTGQTVERLREDTDRDLILSAQEAVAYGLADGVLDSRKARPEERRASGG